MNKNIPLNHDKEFDKISKISKEMQKKNKISRNYIILNNRIKKIYDVIKRYRQSRYKEKSVLFLNEIREKNSIK